VHPPKGRHVHAMSAFIPDIQALGLKWIADFPNNRSLGLATLSAIIVLNDPDSGAPLCIMDSARITATRTAAMTAVSLLACARQNVETAVIIGTGVQAAAQSRTLPAVFPRLRRFFVVGSDLAKAIRFCHDTGSPKFVPAATRKEAVESADIVVTVTNAVRDPLLEADWLMLQRGGEMANGCREILLLIVGESEAVVQLRIVRVLFDPGREPLNHSSKISVLKKFSRLAQRLIEVRPRRRLAPECTRQQKKYQKNRGPL